MSYAPLDDQITKAKKVLGDDAKFPPIKVNLDDLEKKIGETWEKFDEGRDKLETLLKAHEDALDSFANGLKLVGDAYVVDDFGLDEKKDAKKIKQAQQGFAAFFAGEKQQSAKIDKVIDELQKHLVQLEKYKGPGK